MDAATFLVLHAASHSWQSILAAAVALGAVFVIAWLGARDLMGGR